MLGADERVSLEGKVGGVGVDVRCRLQVTGYR